MSYTYLRSFLVPQNPHNENTTLPDAEITTLNKQGFDYEWVACMKRFEEADMDMDLWLMQRNEGNEGSSSEWDAEPVA